MPQISPAHHWFFTWNNYDSSKIQEFSTDLANLGKYVFQQEIGESGTPHLQGYIRFDAKCRPLSHGFDTAIHWEKCRQPKNAIAYCTKEETRDPAGRIYTNITIKKPLSLITTMRPWQATLEQLLQNEPDDRTVFWVHEPTGGAGKSAFAKYMCAKHGALYVSGKSADIKYAIAALDSEEKEVPSIVILDSPRVSNDYISYQGIEEVKNGIFFSTKYESKMVLFNSPHLVVFANQEPDYSKLSLDRWKIFKIENDQLTNTSF